MFAKEPQVRKVTATVVGKMPDSKRKHKQLEFFIVYDTLGREIENGSWGEYTCHYYNNTSDSNGVTISVGCSCDYTKIGNVDFSSYDSMGKKIREENWQYKNNIKNYYSGYTRYHYNRKGVLERKVSFNYNDSMEKTNTYKYDVKGNNIEIIDSDFTRYNSKVSIHKTENKFDSNNRISLYAEYSYGKLLLKKIFLYKDEVETQLRYDNEKDSLSLWSITEIMYDRYSTDSGKEKKQVFEKIINGRDTHDIYKYDKHGLITRIDHYDDLELTSYTRFDYEYY